MMNQQPAQLDPALSALITLQQRANPTTPNGQPTVAAKLSAQAGQGIAGMMPPEGEQERGLPGIIASAQQAAPSVAQNAQQGQVNDMAQQVTQRMQQQQQPTGVTGLPANNMGFAEGGIIPYAEGGGVRTLGGGQLPANFTAPSSVDEQQYFEISPSDLPEIRAYKTLKNRELFAKAYGDGSRTRDMLREAPAQTTQQQAPPTAPQQTASAPRQAAPRPAPGGAAPARANAPMMPSTEYGAGFNPAPVGIASAFAGAPAAPSSSPDVDAARASTAEMAKLMKERPDFLAQELAALDADKQARAAAAAKQKDRQGFEALMAMFAGGAKGGMSGMGEATTAFNREIATRENAAREADRLDALLRVEKGKAAYALKIGDTAALLDARKNIAGMQNQLDQVAATLEGQKVQARGQDIVAGTADKDRAAAMERAKLENASRERAARLGMDRAEKKENLAVFREMAKNKGIVELRKRAIAQGYEPALAKKANDAVDAQLKALAKAYGIPFEEAAAELDALAGGTAGATAPGTPLPSDVAAYLKQYGKGS